MDKYKIPENWKWKKIDDIIKDMKSGGTPRRSNSEYWKDGSIPWLKVSDLRSMYVEDAEEKITEKGLEESSARIFDPGTFLVTIFATVGRVGILKFKAATNQAIVGLTLDEEEIRPKFLFYYLNNIQPYLKEEGRGETQDNINQQILKETLVPTPPTFEQRRIVSKIEELFSKLDAGIKDLQTALEKIRIYKNSIISWIYNGNLVRFDYEECKFKLQDIADINNYPPTDILPDNKEVSFVPMRNVEEETGNMNLNKTRKFGDVKKGYTRFREKDIVFAKITPSMENGKIALAENLENGIGCGSTEFHVITPGEKVRGKFLLYYLLQERIRLKGKKHMKGTSGHMRLRKNYLKNLEIPVPPLKKQSRIISKIENAYSIISKLKEDIQFHIQRTKKLRGSILRKAFVGDLIQTDLQKDNIQRKEAKARPETKETG